MAERKFRILVADDHPFILAALKQSILAESAFELVGEATTGLEALAQARSAMPDIVDVGMPGMNGFLLTRKLRSELPATKVIILTSFEDEAHVKQAIAIGASGHIVMRSAIETLIPAIRGVMTGGTHVDPLVVPRLYRGHSQSNDPVDHLNERERDVLKLNAAGYSNLREFGKTSHIVPTSS